MINDPYNSILYVNLTRPVEIALLAIRPSLSMFKGTDLPVPLISFIYRQWNMKSKSSFTSSSNIFLALPSYSLALSQRSKRRRNRIAIMASDGLILIHLIMQLQTDFWIWFKSFRNHIHKLTLKFQSLYTSTSRQDLPDGGKVKDKK